jgi:branched-chain amino acid transport system ATP-binding protein
MYREIHEQGDDTMILLQIENLVSAYGAITALNGISMEVDKGKVITLLGANGAGKSTALNTISGLIKPSRGSIRFNNREITGLRPDQIAALGLVQVPEGREVLAAMTVEDNLRMGAYTRKDRREIEEDLEETFAWFPRLKERRQQLAGSLSGGEQQMLAIGRALMGRPVLLMLDEPSMGLAPLLVNEVFHIIQSIREQGVTLLLVEQNARKAFEVADYVYILSQGKIVSHGPVEEMKEDNRIIEAYLGL